MDQKQKQEINTKQTKSNTKQKQRNVLQLEACIVSENSTVLLNLLKFTCQVTFSVFCL